MGPGPRARASTWPPRSGGLNALLSFDAVRPHRKSGRAAGSPVVDGGGWGAGKPPPPSGGRPDGGNSITRTAARGFTSWPRRPTPSATGPPTWSTTPPPCSPPPGATGTSRRPSPPAWSRPTCSATPPTACNSPPRYLGELDAGAMTPRGEPEVVADRGAASTWDGRRLPGVWLTAKAVDLAVRPGGDPRRRHRRHPEQPPHRLPGRLPPAGDRPRDDGDRRQLRPGGGQRRPVRRPEGRCSRPDPLAVGIPTDGDPILIDISASITTNGLSDRLRREGQRFPGPWALDAAGRADRRPGRPVRRPARHPAADRRDRPRAQGVRAGAADRGTDPGARRVRAGRGPDRLGGVGVRPGDRPGGVRRAGPRSGGETSWTAAACRATPPVPGVEARPPAGPARPWSTSGGRWRRALPYIRGSWRPWRRTRNGFG